MGTARYQCLTCGAVSANKERKSREEAVRKTIHCTANYRNPSQCPQRPKMQLINYEEVTK